MAIYKMPDEARRGTYAALNELQRAVRAAHCAVALARRGSRDRVTRELLHAVSGELQRAARALRRLRPAATTDDVM